MERRLITQRQKIINALKDAGSDGCTNAELSKISLRYGGHLGNLYRQGYKIIKYNLDGGLYKYVLLSEPSNIHFFRSAQEELVDAMNERIGDVEITEQVQSLLEELHFQVVRKNGWYLNQFDM